MIILTKKAFDRLAPLSSLAAVIRPTSVQFWENGSVCAVLFADAGMIVTRLSRNAAMSAGTVCRWGGPSG